MFSIITQFVPSLCSLAHFPDVAASIAVPTTPSIETFEDPLTTVCAVVVLTVKIRPLLVVAGVGKAKVILLAPLHSNDPVASTTVNGPLDIAVIFSLL